MYVCIKLDGLDPLCIQITFNNYFEKTKYIFFINRYPVYGSSTKRIHRVLVILLFSLGVYFFLERIIENKRGKKGNENKRKKKELFAKWTKPLDYSKIDCSIVSRMKSKIKIKKEWKDARLKKKEMYEERKKMKDNGETNERRTRLLIKIQD